MTEQITLDGEVVDVEHWFSDRRALVSYQNVFALVDRRDDGGWELSGEPARGEEKAILAALLLATMDTTVINVTPPDPRDVS